MLLGEDRLALMRERAKRIGAGVKDGAPEEEFVNSITVVASQVQNLQICAQVGAHEVQVDEPVAGGGDGTAQSPVETLLAALAACTEVNWVAYSSAFGLELEKVDVTVEGTIDHRYLLSGAGSVPARLLAVTITSDVYTVAPKEKIERVHEKVQKFCPVAGSLHPSIQKDYTLSLHPPET
ncbi:MAG TPA: OsmC family protein [Candidatus Lokiarchaeia archaeon]|nr:OsmC family protein [Candidatus Lokiarchaeia archaeon]